MNTVLEQLQVLAGVEPSTDKPNATTKHYTDALHIRFCDGFPEKIGGWESLSFNDDDVIVGKTRTIFSYKINGFFRYLLGTNTNLYDITGTQLTNITPVKTTTIAIADSLDTHYDTLINNPIATVDGSTTLTITDAGHNLQTGDTATLSGSAAVNGVPNSEINTDLFVRSVATNSYTVIVSTPATSTGSGGGASVVRSSGIITVNASSNGISDGDRAKIANAATTGGITNAQINLEFIVRNTTTNTFDIYTAGTATSSVTGGGGGSTTYQEPIDAGNADTLLGQGYGVGLYGVGLYGVSKTSSNASGARIWSHDRFGDLTISCAGDSTAIYSWDGDVTEAPAPVSNAPTANYVFTSNNIVVALGYDGADKDNGISWSDQGGLTDWSSGQAGSDTIEGAGRFISHSSARGENILFTANQCYTFRYIGGQFIWQTILLDAGVGIIAQNARVSADGIVYWMGNRNFYMWRGGSVEVIPSNSSQESTILNYVFDDINFGQKEKIFSWYNQKFREVWWHYPSSTSNEPDRIARLNVDTGVWVYDEITRTAGEYPSILSETPYLSDDSSVIYLHENGFNNNGSAMDWRLSTNNIYGGTDTIQISAFVPDNIMTGNMNVQIETKDYPNDVTKQTQNYTVSGSTGRVPTEQNGRFWKFTLSGSDLDQNIQIGQWYHEIKRSSPK